MYKGSQVDRNKNEVSEQSVTTKDDTINEVRDEFVGSESNIGIHINDEESELNRKRGDYILLYYNCTAYYYCKLLLLLLY